MMSLYKRIFRLYWRCGTQEAEGASTFILPTNKQPAAAGEGIQTDSALGLEVLMLAESGQCRAKLKQILPRLPTLLMPE